MVLSEVLERLRERGFGNIRTARIHYAIRAGYVDKPPLNGSLSYDFGESHLRQIEQYLRNPPSRGPKPTAQPAS